MKTILLLLAIHSCGISSLNATTDTLYPEAGKPCPDFLLKNVAYYQKNEVTGKDFKGKWLVLDFWNKYCSSCVESFPKMNAMQKKFGDRVQIMLVGIQDAESKIRPMYDRFQKKYDLQMACAFDSSLSNYWGIYSTPQIIVIDDKGIVRAVTYKIDSADMATFLKGERPVLPVSYYAQQKNGPDIRDEKIPFEDHQPYMIRDNGAKSDTHFLFRSIITKWNQVNQTYYHPVRIDLHAIDPTFPEGMFQAMAVSLRQLYMYAYFGRMLWEANDTLYYGNYADNPIVEVKDSSLFQTTATENWFCYSLIMPSGIGTKENLQQAMQRDLETYFGFNVSIESRKFPCWRLVATDKAAAKLATKGGKEAVEEIIPRVSYQFSNVPMVQLINYFGIATNEVIIDETGIIQHVDFTSSFMDLDEMKDFLPKYGLKLIPAEKEMKVIVIRDRKN